MIFYRDEWAQIPGVLNWSGRTTNIINLKKNEKVEFRKIKAGSRRCTSA
jgi:hypothetical protein